MCGNFDGDEDNDLVCPNGKTAKDADAFNNCWR